MILAVDFDGVIHDVKNPVPGRRMGAPIPGAQEHIQALKSQGHIVIVHCVWAHDSGTKVIADWMDYYGIPFDDITNIKPLADVYLDDKAIRFTSWEDFSLEKLSTP